MIRPVKDEASVEAADYAGFLSFRVCDIDNGALYGYTANVGPTKMKGRSFMKKNRFVHRISVFLCILLLLGTFAFSAQAEEGSTPPTSGQCGEAVTWVYDPVEGILTISGSGPMYDYSNSPWHWNQYAIKTLVVEEGVTRLGSCAFDHFAQLTTVSLPDSLESIGELAFHYSYSLEAIEIPDRVTVMEPGVFDQCSGLKDVKLSKSLTVLERHTFYLCESLSSLHIPEGVTSIGDVAFYQCTSLTDLVIPQSVTSFGSRPFSKCTGLQNISFGGTRAQWESLMRSGESGLSENVTVCYNAPRAHEVADGVCRICGWTQVVGGECGRDLTWELDLTEGVLRITGTGPMYSISDVPVWDQYKSAITGVELPEGMVSISPWAFENCTYLEYIVLPSSISSVGHGAFWNCTGLKGITVLHPKCDIHPKAWALSDPETLVIYGQPNSAVQSFVEELGYTFRPVCLCEGGRGCYEITDTQANCYQGGDRLYHCTVCDYSCRTNVVPVSHSYSYTDMGEFHVGTCSCGAEIREAHSYTDHVCVCGRLFDIPIQHTLDLESDISLSFVVREEYLQGFNFVYMTVKIPEYDGNTQVSYGFDEIYGTTRDGYRYFTVSGLHAGRMNDEIEATLCLEKNGVTYKWIDRYSIAQYAMTQLNKKDVSATFKTLCADLLRYGAATQIYKGYRTDTLADRDFTEEHRSYLTDLGSVSFGPKYVWTPSEEPKEVTFVGKSLNLQSKITARFVVDLSNYSGSSSDLTLRVSHFKQDGTYTETVVRDPMYYGEDGNYMVFTYYGLNAAELRQELTLVVCKNNVPVSDRVTYAMDSYGNGKSGTLLTLCQALFAYSDSAKAFFTA